MKKAVHILLLSFCLALFFPITAYSDNAGWDTKPVITEIYEVAENTLQVKWEGEAEAYRIYLDNKELHPVKGVEQIQIEKMKSGTHRISIIPIQYVSKSGDSRADISFDLPEISIPIIGSIPNISVSGSWDWKSLGIDPKDIVNGTESGLCEFNYTPSTLFQNKPEIKALETDFDDSVVVTFKDLYDADGYRICITQGKNDERYYDFFLDTAETKAFINKADSTVTVKLDREYLREMHWLVPDLNEEYGFQVQLVQYSKNIVGEKEPIPTSVLYSKFSNKEKYTPTSRWKLAPEITYNSQDGEGSVLLAWEHDDNGLGCQYKIVKYDKLVVVKTGEKEIGITAPGEREFEITDLVNGKYTFAVIPVLGKETGNVSEAVTIDVSADWVTAPELNCSVTGSNEVTLSWISSPRVESYHITVSVGSGSLLRYVNLDFKKYLETEVPVGGETMEYIFRYPETVDSEDGVKIRFEVYGIRHTADNTEQTSSTSKQMIILN